MRRQAAGLNPDGEAVLEAAFEHMYNAVVITDADFGGGPFIQSCNPAFCAMTGYTEEELIGQSPRILQGPNTDRKVINQLNRKIRAGEFFEGSTINYRKDGVSYVVRWNISPVRDARGSIVAYISIQQDITERFQAVQRIADSEQQYRLVAENMRDFVAHVRDGRIVWASPSVKGVLGATPEYWIGREAREMVPLEDVPASADHWAILMAGGIVQERVRVVAVDGVVHWVHLHANPFYDADGRQDGLVASLRLIDDEVAAEQALEQARRQQASANDLMKRELESAAVYMSSIMPTDLTGRVAAASRYLPSRELGGDCFDYAWIDDDHLLVYLIDVSGHGLEPALLSVSVHNMIRSGSLTNAALREPGNVLTELNRRFQMGQHRQHYFTMWCGVYEASTRTLRYASGGAPLRWRSITCPAKPPR